VAGFWRIAELGAGWMSLSASAEAVAGELEKLRDLAGGEVPVIHCDVGEPTAGAIEGYRDLAIEHLMVELPTGTRDQTRRRLDDLWTVFGKLD
jgi:hypothetical protein